MDWIGLDRIGSDRIGLDWIGLEWNGIDSLIISNPCTWECRFGCHQNI